MKIPSGFKASALSCGIKKRGKLDLALIFSEVPARAAGVFTNNKLPAAPVKVAKEHLKKSNTVQAIIANSGNANSFTGNGGVEDAKKEALYLSKVLGIKAEAVLVASTGIIGKRLELEKIKNAVPSLVRNLSKNGIAKAARAIMTTDTFAKISSNEFSAGGGRVVITGMTKGAGMIAPDMATMLCFIMTDANITQRALRSALKEAVDKSFNCITVDGCMSTNDTVLILANGRAANFLIDAGSKACEKFSDALSAVCLNLAKMMVKDAEGISKFIEIEVKGARNDAQAKRAALAIANSNLFKTALYGENPNWGRVVAAIGASGIDVLEGSLKIRFSSLAKKDIFVDVNLNIGKGRAVVYTSDLTPEYIKINAEYN
jgi:glutamate N-acetyltransferase/amino-acid N-acetyltransferase